jgi:hypothetical protein
MYGYGSYGYMSFASIPFYVVVITPPASSNVIFLSRHC